MLDVGNDDMHVGGGSGDDGDDVLEDDIDVN